MTETLAEKTCTPCRGGIPPLTREAQRLQAQAPDWQLADDAHRIERTFRFRNFQELLTFVQEVGELAETEGHHPDVSFGWGYATVFLSTKKIKGLHENDFIMARSSLQQSCQALRPRLISEHTIYGRLPRSKFPANREINREFRRIRQLGAILKAAREQIQRLAAKFPYATEQGIFLTEQGISTQEQGICPGYSPA